MRIKVTFENGDHLVTRINASPEQAKKYYIDREFNFNEILTKAVGVELLEPELVLANKGYYFWRKTDEAGISFFSVTKSAVVPKMESGYYDLDALMKLKNFGIKKGRELK